MCHSFYFLIYRTAEEMVQQGKTWKFVEENISYDLTSIAT